MPMFFIKIDDGNYGYSFVSEICSDGLLLTTTKIEGHPVHPTMRKFRGERCNKAMRFSTSQQAQRVIDIYNRTRLPKGKKHSTLEVINIREATLLELQLAS